jgi:hypothetical protein
MLAEGKVLIALLIVLYIMFYLRYETYKL